MRYLLLILLFLSACMPKSSIEQEGFTQISESRLFKKETNTTTILISDPSFGKSSYTFIDKRTNQAKVTILE